MIKLQAVQFKDNIKLPGKAVSNITPAAQVQRWANVFLNTDEGCVVAKFDKGDGAKREDPWEICIPITDVRWYRKVPSGDGKKMRK